MKFKWFCRDCWRSGEGETFHELDAPLPHAVRLHYEDVSRDMQAAKTPAGLEKLRNTAIMQKYPAVDCKGDVLLGERKGRHRVKRADSPTFPEFGDMKP